MTNGCFDESPTGAEADAAYYRAAATNYRSPGAQRRTQSDNTDAWDDPDWTVLDDRRGELPEFPTDVFSGLCGQWLESAAHGAGVSAAKLAAVLAGESPANRGVQTLL
jgi:hypothetical protein